MVATNTSGDTNTSEDTNIDNNLSKQRHKSHHPEHVLNRKVPGKVERDFNTVQSHTKSGHEGFELVVLESSSTSSLASDDVLKETSSSSQSTHITRGENVSKLSWSSDVWDASSSEEAVNNQAQNDESAASAVGEVNSRNVNTWSRPQSRPTTTTAATSSVAGRKKDSAKTPTVPAATNEEDDVEGMISDLNSEELGSIIALGTQYAFHEMQSASERGDFVLLSKTFASTVRRLLSSFNDEVSMGQGHTMSTTETRRPNLDPESVKKIKHYAESIQEWNIQDPKLQRSHVQGSLNVAATSHHFQQPHQSFSVLCSGAKMSPDYKTKLDSIYDIVSKIDLKVKTPSPTKSAKGRHRCTDQNFVTSEKEQEIVSIAAAESTTVHTTMAAAVDTLEVSRPTVESFLQQELDCDDKSPIFKHTTTLEKPLKMQTDNSNPPSNSILVGVSTSAINYNQINDNHCSHEKFIDEVCGGQARSTRSARQMMRLESSKKDKNEEGCAGDDCHDVEKRKTSVVSSPQLPPLSAEEIEFELNSSLVQTPTDEPLQSSSGQLPSGSGPAMDLLDEDGNFQLSPHMLEKFKPSTDDRWKEAMLDIQFIRKTKDVLKKTFGFNNFRPEQIEVIAAISSGRNVFINKPTAFGKTLCFLLPTVMHPGLCVVISPLLALINDLEQRLRAWKIRFVTMVGSRNKWMHDGVCEKLLQPSDNTKLLIVTPELLESNGKVIKTLQVLNSQGRVQRFVLDEAHLMLQWGLTFRQDYLQLQKLKKNIPGVQIVFASASAPKNYIPIIVAQLDLESYVLLEGSVLKPKLSITVVEKNGSEGTLVDKLLKENSLTNSSGIVYCLTRQNCIDMWSSLQALDYKVGLYHGDIDPGVRTAVQKEWQNGTIKIMVATIAFGLGIDNANVRFVVHTMIPESVEAFYQEVSRAGRDGEEANCFILYRENELVARLNLIFNNDGSKSREESAASLFGNEQTPSSLTSSSPSLPDKVKKLKRNLVLSVASIIASKTKCIQQAIAEYFGEINVSECEKCSVCKSKHQYAIMDVTSFAKTIIQVLAKLNDQFTEKRPGWSANQLYEILIGKKGSESWKTAVVNGVDKRRDLWGVFGPTHQARPLAKQIIYELIFAGYIKYFFKKWGLKFPTVGYLVVSSDRIPHGTKIMTAVARTKDVSFSDLDDDGDEDGIHDIPAGSTQQMAPFNQPSNSLRASWRHTVGRKLLDLPILNVLNGRASRDAEPDGVSKRPRLCTEDTRHKLDTVGEHAGGKHSCGRHPRTSTENVRAEGSGGGSKKCSDVQSAQASGVGGGGAGGGVGPSVGIVGMLQAVGKEAETHRGVGCTGVLDINTTRVSSIEDRKNVAGADPMSKLSIQNSRGAGTAGKMTTNLSSTRRPPSYGFQDPE